MLLLKTRDIESRFTMTWMTENPKSEFSHCTDYRAFGFLNGVKREMLIYTKEKSLVFHKLESSLVLATEKQRRNPHMFCQIDNLGSSLPAAQRIEGGIKAELRLVGWCVFLF